MIAMMCVLPLRAQTPEPNPGPPQQSWIAVCIVVCAGVAVVGIYLVAKKCEPKYYWLMDDNEPPTFWVGTATKKECTINGWNRIGGPYTKASDAPTQHPNPTNRVENIVGPPVNISVQSSTDGANWSTVHTEQCDLDDFGYIVPTNAPSAAMFRLIQH